MSIIFASDFDNTLFFNEHEVHQSDIDMINTFQKEGNLFGLCTGRSWKGITFYTEGKVKFDFAILATGSFIMNRNEEVIFRKEIRLPVVEAITSEFESQYKLAFNGGYDFYSLKSKYMEMTQVNSVKEVPHQIVGISFLSESPEKAEQLCQHINSRYPVSAFHNKSFVDITSIGSSKGTGIAFIKEYFHVNEIAGMGDSFNDITLLNSCHPSFTFPSSPDILKQNVDVITNSVAESLEYLLRHKNVA